MFRIGFALLLGVGLVAVIACAIRWLLLRASAQRRWFDLADRLRSLREGGVPFAERTATTEARSWLGRWLYLAGYRQPQAPAIFVALTLSTTAIGTAIAFIYMLSGLQALMEQSVVRVPGGVGETFLPVVWVAPWLLLLMVACFPWLVVRRARRQRVELVEQDLPLALELLSTLSEAGLGFDAALSRILKTRLAGRPLAEDFRNFQADLLAGRPRTESLRRFSSRLELVSISSFVSALVQAEQLGMGIARVLRQQADDVRSKRRERAIAFANSLATKRVIPLVVCFLPGLFVWTLGPAFVQLFKMAETFIQVRNF